MSRRHHRDCKHKKAIAHFDQLLSVEFDVIFDVDAELDDDSITVEVIDTDDDDDPDC